MVKVTIINNYTQPSNQELLILVGPPHCGKRTFFNNNKIYSSADSPDEAKIKLKKGENVCVLNCNPTFNDRKRYIKIARSLNKQVRILWFMDFKLYKKNGENKVPNCVYDIYQSILNPPSYKDEVDSIMY